MPPLQPLEPVDDLKQAIFQGNHPDRQITQLLLPPKDHARPESFIGGLEPLEWNKEDLSPHRILRGRGDGRRKRE